MKRPSPDKATQAAKSADKARGVARADERATTRVQALASASRRLASSASAQGMLSALHEGISTPFGIDFGVCYVLESEGQSLRLAAHAGLPESVARERPFETLNGSFCSQVTQQIRPRIEEQVQRSTDRELEHIRSLGVRSYACFPLLANGRLLGALSFGSRQRDRIDADDVAALETLCTQFAIGLQLRRSEESARNLESVIQKRTAEQVESYTYSVTHDLRAPLRAIRGFAQALVEDYSSALDETGRDYLKRMDEGAARLDALIHDLLQYSRLGRAPLIIEPLDVEACLKAALQPLEDTIARSHAVIVVNRPLPAVLGDAGILQQLLTQLVSNALKFVDRTVVPRVRVSGQVNGHSVRIWIEDNGLGIAQAYQERIFGVFERLHSTEAYPGTGIGLALVRKGIEQLGGTVGVESALGSGSRFWIELPKAPTKG